MRAINALTENKTKIKAAALIAVLILTAILGGKSALYWQETEVKQKEALASFVNKYSGYKDPREKCISELLRKEENPSLWAVRSCLKKKQTSQ